MRKVFLDELPKHTNGCFDGKVDWRGSVGMSFEFIYDEISGKLKIVDYKTDGKQPKVCLEYNGSENWAYTNNVVHCKIAKVINVKTRNKPIFEDLSGQRFGKLVVLCDDESRSSTGQISWKCLCDCGQITHVIGHRLKIGHTKSCGCMARNRFKQKYRDNSDLRKTAVSRIIGRYRSKAKQRSIEWKISRDVFEEMIEMPCYYCGEEHSLSMTILDYTYKYNGLDRINSNLGYEEKNVVPCCKSCNMAKSDMKQRDFYKWALKVADYIKVNRLVNYGAV